MLLGLFFGIGFTIAPVAVAAVAGIVVVVLGLIGGFGVILAAAGMG